MWQNDMCENVRHETHVSPWNCRPVDRDDVHAVPEPNMLPLMLAGLALLIGIRRWLSK